MSRQAISEERAALAQSVRDLADYLERHPEIPVSFVTALMSYVERNQQRSHITELIDTYGFKLEEDRHVDQAVLPFGDRVRLSAMFTPEAVLVPSIDPDGTTVRWGLPAPGLKAVAA